MATNSRPPHTPAVHVVLDTNALFTKYEDKLVSEELSAFVLSDANSLGLRTTWYLPEIVKLERRAQMSARAIQLLPNVTKIEKLLGHNLNITPDILSMRVDEVIARERERHKFEELTVDYGAVDWDRMVRSAADRLPPFQSGETEKGFKDGIVLEAVCQLAERLPRSPAHARIALLTGDEILSSALKDRSKNWANVYALSDVGALRTMMTAIASHLSDDLVASIIPKASAAFLGPQGEGFYYKWDIGSQLVVDGINVTRPSTLAGAVTKTLGIFVNHPNIKEKASQKLTFVTNIEVRIERTSYVPRRLMTQQPANALGDHTIVWRGGGLGTIGQPTGQNALKGLLAAPPLPTDPLFDEVKQEVLHTFEVEWSATLTQAGNLTRGALVAVRLKPVE